MSSHTLTNHLCNMSRKDNKCFFAIILPDRCQFLRILIKHQMVSMLIYILHSRTAYCLGSLSVTTSRIKRCLCFYPAYPSHYPCLRTRRIVRAVVVASTNRTGFPFLACHVLIHQTTTMITNEGGWPLLNVSTSLFTFLICPFTATSVHLYFCDLSIFHC